ncbi:hypothetical protein CFP56_041361 [Quercus suber]|uniref:DUF4283 domain-containing protein n=1 Tax=Quercus suber TaxID=58331 RepID=A0AAW0IW17_QUESU
MEDTHTSDEDGLTEEAWEIKVTIKMKCKMAGPWQTSIILKLIALQTKLAGIWRPAGKTHLIDIGYGFFIMRFDTLMD